MTDARMKTGLEELAESYGGSWTFDMLTQAERDFFSRLMRTWEETELVQDWKKQKNIENRMNLFFLYMDEKYAFG